MFEVIFGFFNWLLSREAFYRGEKTVIKASTTSPPNANWEGAIGHVVGRWSYDNDMDLLEVSVHCLDERTGTGYIYLVPVGELLFELCWQDFGGWGIRDSTGNVYFHHYG